MKKRFLSILLAIVMAFSILPTASLAADSVEEALGEIDIYNGGEELSYLMINGRVRTLIYTYYNFVNSRGETKEIPAYCVNPNITGVPQTVGVGESIEYLAEEKTSDPKVLGIVANGYPTRSLKELGLENKYQGYYATKMALWCYLLSNWDINNLKVNSSLTGVELQRAQKMLAAAKDIYARGTSWSEVLAPEVTCTPDRPTAYEVTIDGKQYKQQVFTFWSKTWVCDYAVEVFFTDPGSAPQGTRIVDMNNRDITTITTKGIGDGYAGQFKVLYPLESVQGETGSVQLSFRTDVYKYAVYYAVCAEKDKYGNIQNYVVDTDPTTGMDLSTFSSYADQPVEEYDTGLRILKYETGTEIPISGCRFEVIGPDGDSVGTFVTNGDGRIEIPLSKSGNYTVIEREAASHYVISEEPAQNVTVVYDEIAEVTFFNDPYGSLRIEKKSNTGMNLPGAVIKIEHIESGQTWTATTTSAGVAIFDEIPLGAYRIQEISAPAGWQIDDTVYTATVVTGETTTIPIINVELPGLRIIKYDRKNMAAMPDVTFAVYRDGEFLGNYKTDEFGEILLTDVKPGTYRAFEVNTDEGHILDTTPQEVELHAGDGIKELLFFNDMKPGLRLVKVDSDDPSKAIPNAVFEIKSVEGTYGPQEFRTDENGEIDLSMLPAGSYVVTEKSCDGYVIDEAQRIIELKPNENAQFVFTNHIKPSLQLIKLSSDGSRLAGVTFRIAKIEDGSHYLDRTTNSAGEILISGLEPGVYSVRELSSVLDHVPDDTEHHVELFPGQTSTITLTNDKRPNLYIHKADGDTGAPIPGTVYLVKGADGHSIAEVKTDENGVAVVENLLPGVVEVIEKSVPEPYLLAEESQMVTLLPNRDRNVYFENYKRPVIEIIKENEITHDRLENVPVQVWYASNNTATGEYNDLGVYYTDEEGRIVLSDPDLSLRDGWFRIEELEPPKGFSLTESSKQEAFIAAGEGHTFRIFNRPNSAICVWKYDSETGAAIEGAVFQVRYLSGNTSGTGGTVIGTYRTSVNGSFTVTGCKAGTYIIEELSSDGSHVIDTPPQTVYLSGQEQEVVQVHFGNSPKGAVLVKKVSDDDKKLPLSGVEFFVTTSDGTVVGDANGKFVTDSSGSFLVENIAPGTSLVVKETRAKPGYLLDDVPQTVQVKAGQTVTLEFRNKPLGNLVIEKWGRNGTKTVPLEGVKFEIKYANGQFVDAAGGTLSSNGIYYSDSSGKITLSGVTGTVIVTELESVSGYTIDPDSQSQTVTINPNDTQTLRFYNNAVGGVEIIKVNASKTSERIPDTTFEIRRMDDALVDTITTDRNGRAYLALEDGSYYAVEIEANPAFRLDDTPHYFEVKDGKVTTLRIKNEANSGILIHKVDTSGEGIYGVKFLLYDEDRNPIGEFTSDDEGYVYITADDLPDGANTSGRFYLRELEAAEGYILDKEYKTVYVRPGRTAEIEWVNAAITAQIQIWKKSADDNPINGFPAGTPLEGAVFEVYNKANALVDTIESNSRGLAVSKPLPLGRYTIKEVSSPQFYSVSNEQVTVYLEHEGQIVQIEFRNESVYTNVSIHKTGYTEVVPGQSIRYTFKDIGNNSTVPLGSFYWRDTLPTDAVRLDKIITGTWSARLNYKVVFQTNLNNTQRVLADNLNTLKNYTLDASAAALGLASNEYVTQVTFLFGQVPSGFRQVETPYIYCNVLSGLSHEYRFTNKCDVGGLWKNQWVQATDRWVTITYRGGPTPTLPRTGY